MWYDIKTLIKELLIDLGIILIKCAERYKNRCLAQRLRDLADLYDPK